MSHRTFRGLAERGKPSVDWFFGFKLHLVFNDGAVPGKSSGFSLACREHS